MWNCRSPGGAGGRRTCGVKNGGGAVVCCGSDLYGESTPPGGRFTDVSAGGDHACGLRRHGAIECWCSNEDINSNLIGQATPPQGVFHNVTAAGFYTCGVKANGTVECWGDDSYGGPTPVKWGRLPSDRRLRGKAQDPPVSSIAMLNPRFLRGHHQRRMLPGADPAGHHSGAVEDQEEPHSARTAEYRQDVAGQEAGVLPRRQQVRAPGARGPVPPEPLLRGLRARVASRRRREIGHG